MGWSATGIVAGRAGDKTVEHQDDLTVDWSGPEAGLLEEGVETSRANMPAGHAAQLEHALQVVADAFGEGVIDGRYLVRLSGHGETGDNGRLSLLLDLSAVSDGFERETA